MIGCKLIYSLVLFECSLVLGFSLSCCVVERVSALSTNSTAKSTQRLRLDYGVGGVGMGVICIHSHSHELSILPHWNNNRVCRTGCLSQMETRSIACLMSDVYAFNSCMRAHFLGCWLPSKRIERYMRTENRRVDFSVPVTG